MNVYKQSGATIVEIPKSKISRINFSLCKQPTETLKSFYDRQTEKPDFIMNGGFFSMSNGKTCFSYIDEGKDLSASLSYTVGMGITYDNQLVYGGIKDYQWKDFISAYPPLIENGKVCPISFATEINYKARRSVLAYNDTTVFLIAVESNGMTFKAVQDLLLTLNVTYAINLDGGGSTKILQNGKSITSSIYNRAVDNVITVYLNKLYRVQVGAFSSVANATALQSKIRALPDSIGAGYKNAYVRKIGNYHKVQVGAFSKEANAQKVLADLKAKGFEGFITTE